MFKTIQTRISTMTQRCSSQYQQITLFCIIVFSIGMMLFVGSTRLELKLEQPVHSLTTTTVIATTLINFDDIKIDPDRSLRDRMIFHKRNLGINQKNKTWYQEIQSFLTRVSPFYHNKSICADYWIVAFEFSDNVLETAKRLPNWCILVVMEADVNIDQAPGNIFRLTGVIQHDLAEISPFYKESLLLPKGLHTSQKNLGYLWAIYHEATIIGDFDHTNEIPISQTVLPFPLNETMDALIVSNYTTTLFNPYSVFVSNIHPLWPRGYPFRSFNELRKQETPLHVSRHLFPTKNVAVIHSLIEGYTDFYGTYRHVKPNLPLSANKVYNDSTKDITLIAPHHTFSPYDQQTTLHLRSAFWALLLPVTVEQQASDSFRSYVMQRLMWDVGFQTVFAGSFLYKRYTDPGVEDTPLLFRKSDTVRHAEKRFYWQIDGLIHFLTQWSASQKDFIERIEQLFVALHERDHIKMYDLYLLQLWLQELYQIGYVFPTVVS